MNENAFAFIVQARPCPTFGRPVHLRGSPHRLQPGTSPHALRIPPHDGHPALRELRSGGSRSALVCFRLSPSCPFRPLHTFHSSRPARHYPRFWIQRSSFKRRRDFNPPEQRAAQRTLWASPPLCSASVLGSLRRRPLGFLPSHRNDRFLCSLSKPVPRSRHLHAGRRLDSKQVASNLCSRDRSADPVFDADCIRNDTSSVVHSRSSP